jgi:hypothetical protein
VPQPTDENSTRLLIVTGSGRSGTSTVAGALKRLGLHVPQPEQPPDETNPKGFYEPIWVVDFHKRLLNSVPARTNDARPRAAEEISSTAAAPELREELTAWLAEQAAVVGPGGQLVVKDPRAFWVHDLWSAVAKDLGVDLCYLTMLRHPAEVVQSRETHYLADKTDDFRSLRQTANLAGWVNSAYESERGTRSHPRAFVRYVDLLADWRAALSRAEGQLGVTFNADLSEPQHHGVDDFIDVALHRSRANWDDVDTMPELRELAEVVWEAHDTFVESPYDDGAIRALEGAHRRYVDLHRYAEAIALDHTNISVAQARRELQAKLRRRSRRTPAPRPEAAPAQPDTDDRPPRFFRKRR